mmetsp:Transcript_26275/g.57796  ORF Transcript_26275/g.57796 Transcript_26275/m.57796 type:complete len:104 (+) Transcript_26275:671-982(+)
MWPSCVEESKRLIEQLSCADSSEAAASRTGSDPWPSTSRFIGSSMSTMGTKDLSEEPGLDEHEDNPLQPSPKPVDVDDADLRAIEVSPQAALEPATITSAQAS